MVVADGRLGGTAVTGGRIGTVAAVLLDRDGTLVEDVPYNPDPARVRLLPGVLDAVRALRSYGVRLGLLTNQSGIGRGLLSPPQVAAVNARVAELVGGFDVVHVCPHVDSDQCRCRKPLPGMVIDALADLGVPARRAALVGDIGADVEAGIAAGVRSILVPTPVTRQAEIYAAPEVAPTLAAAVHLILDGHAE
jgi:histidinol-phosphate phosphatase family protein